MYYDNILAMMLIRSLVMSLVITEILELAASACFPKRNLHDFIVVFLVNIITNPVVVYLTFWFGHRLMPYYLWVIMIESTVWISESLIFRKCLKEKHNPFLYSFVLNASSYFGGMLLDYII